jgi:carboxyl-terminal processing protease
LPGQGSYWNPQFLVPGKKLTIEGHCTQVTTQLGIEFLETRPQDQPFFLMLHHKAPHREWDPDLKNKALFADREFPEPPTLWDDYKTRPAALPENEQTIANDLTRRDLKLNPPEELQGQERNKWLGVKPTSVTVDGQNAKGRSTEEVLYFLRGFPGTKAELTVRRPGSAKDVRISLERAEIESKNVPHSGMVAEGVGYVYLTTFTRDAGQNVAEALRKLKTQHPNLKGVVLDLRQNGGGLLDEAVKLSNVFINRGELIVSTKGKVPEWDRSFSTSEASVDTDIPVAVLIDNHSASASEIVSGAIQDLDRGVLIGQRSYGKGLVQNQKDIGYNARIKLTTAKYYIPSGRCIQAVRYKNGEPVDIPEAERAPFKTRNGRTVLDGGGVKPDVLIPVDTPSGITRALLEQNTIFNYVTEWAIKHPAIDSAEAFKFQEWPSFAEYVKQSGFQFETEAEKQLKALQTAAEKDQISLSAEINAVQTRIQIQKAGALEAQKNRIIREIESEIVGRYYFQSGKVRKSLVNDPYVEEAVKLFNDPARYRSILKG